MRMKIVDKSKSLFQHAGQSTQHLVQLDNLKFEPTDQGYLIVIEGVMPYNTTENQIVLDVSTNQENLDFVEVMSCEPVEYTDKYVPFKYGIIFKEKVVV